MEPSHVVFHLGRFTDARWAQVGMTRGRSLRRSSAGSFAMSRKVHRDRGLRSTHLLNMSMLRLRLWASVLDAHSAKAGCLRMRSWSSGVPSGVSTASRMSGFRVGGVSLSGELAAVGATWAASFGEWVFAVLRELGDAGFATHRSLLWDVVGWQSGSGRNRWAHLCPV